jgi:hypothetical protein
MRNNRRNGYFAFAVYSLLALIAFLVSAHYFHRHHAAVGVLARIWREGGIGAGLITPGRIGRRQGVTAASS